MQKIKRALISVSDKTGIVEFARFLEESGVEIISTGGTAKKLKEENIKVKDISEHTGFPEIMDGRVKTLHPKVHGGLLAVRDDEKHAKQMQENGIQDIDMVVVNLYPFEETVARGAEFDEVIENIDIGGPSMIRSAAKNHKYVTVIVNPERYEGVMDVMKQNDGHTSPEIRKALAAEAFSRTSVYDSAIANWFEGQLGIQFPENLSLVSKRKKVLRYGENPHQKAALYVYGDNSKSAANAQVLQGKELSFNNILDADSALEIVKEFEQPAAVIVKHNNPCGVAVGEDICEAFEKANNCDPVSAFGGIFAFNREVDSDTATKCAEIFCEVIIAPSFSDSAREIFAKKKNLRLLQVGEFEQGKISESINLKSIQGGLLIQESDNIVYNEAELKVVTDREPTKQEMNDLLFAFAVCKHVKSNGIVFVKDGTTVGIGAGQMSRVDSSRIGAWKAKETNKNTDSAKGAVMASDAFFPFADGLEAAAKEGVTAVIQPGGSMRDQEVIDAANKANIAMVFTGVRHFRH
jgi:phosphoribosylaminoimidazolecarboxamide formyltransferase/IMP cyclohydrolase